MLVLAVNRTVKVNIKLNINLVALKNILGQHQLAGSSTGCFFLFLCNNKSFYYYIKKENS